MTTPAELPVNPQLFTGIDVGGTKVHILDSSSNRPHYYPTANCESMEAVLDNYFVRLGERPVHICVAMAGPRDDETGTVKGTNFDWPEFSPAMAEKHYPGTTFETVNDMIGSAAGVMVEQGIEFETLKSGTPAPQGTKLVMAVSTGIGAAAAVWDRYSKRYVYVPGEGGHIGFQPKNQEEMEYLQFLQAQQADASAEVALSGKHGIENLIEHVLRQRPTERLAAQIEKAKQEKRPVGAVLREVAEYGDGTDKQTAHDILHTLGSMLGSVVRDLTVTFNATGGVYLTGTVAQALGDYFAEKTDFIERFIHPGAVHDERLESIPIYLVKDPEVAVKGALTLAQTYAESLRD